MTLIEVCPDCQQRRVEGERFCWFCGRDHMKRDDTTCYECGASLKRTPIEKFRRIYRDVLCG